MKSVFSVNDLSSNLTVLAVGEAPPLAPDLEDRVEAIWREEAAISGRTLFNGVVFSVTEMTARRIEGHFVEYRLFIAQRRHPSLFADLKIRPLGVSGLLTCPDGIVFGKRADGVTQNPGMWELVPAGGVDPACADASGKMDLRKQLIAELTEEVGLPDTAVSIIDIRCLIENNIDHVLDIGMELSVGMPAADIIAAHGNLGSKEYDEITVVTAPDLESFVYELGDRLVEEGRLMLKYLNHLS